MKKKLNSFIYIGGAISAALTLVFLVGLVWTPYDSNAMNAKAKFAGPSAEHLLG